MRWLLLLLVVVGTGAFVVQYLATREARQRPQARRTAHFAWAILSLVLLAAAVYTAHWIGLFSVPLVAVAFVAVGLPLRLVLAGTRSSRPTAETGPVGRRRARMWSRLELPALVVSVAAIAALAVVVGGLVGAR